MEAVSTNIEDLARLAEGRGFIKPFVGFTLSRLQVLPWVFSVKVFDVGPQPGFPQSLHWTARLRGLENQTLSFRAR